MDNRSTSGNASNISEAEETALGLGGLFGTEHPWFWSIHITALVSLGASIIISIATLIFLVCSGTSWNIFKRKFSERLVVYLAVADILYSSEHSFGHSYAIAVAFSNGTFNADICLSSSFMLGELICGQGIIVSITALSAFVMVVLNRKVSFGRNDWALLVCSLGLPAIPGAAFAILGWFGPAGFWCLADMESTGGPIISLFYACFPIGVTVIVSVCYIGVWITIQIQSRRMSHFAEGDKAKEERRKYQKTAQVLTLFIVSYIAQYLLWIIFCIWSFFAPPSSLMINLVVCTTNMGGVFNFFAYTFVRRSTAAPVKKGPGATGSSATVSTIA